MLLKRNPVKQGTIRFKFSSFYLNKLNFDTKLKEIYAGIVFCKHFNNVHSPLDPLDLFIIFHLTPSWLPSVLPVTRYVVLKTRIFGCFFEIRQV